MICFTEQCIFSWLMLGDLNWHGQPLPSERSTNRNMKPFCKTLLLFEIGLLVYVVVILSGDFILLILQQCIVFMVQIVMAGSNVQAQLLLQV